MVSAVDCSTAEPIYNVGVDNFGIIVPPIYEYDGSILTVNPEITVEPTECDFAVTYYCKPQIERGVDICDSSINSERTISNFDTQTGILTFSTTDVPGVEPALNNVDFYQWFGVYNSVETLLGVNFVFRLSDPCSNFEIGTNNFYFPDDTNHYIIDDPVKSFAWNAENIALLLNNGI